MVRRSPVNRTRLPMMCGAVIALTWVALIEAQTPALLLFGGNNHRVSSVASTATVSIRILCAIRSEATILVLAAIVFGTASVSMAHALATTARGINSQVTRRLSSMAMGTLGAGQGAASDASERACHGRRGARGSRCYQREDDADWSPNNAIESWSLTRTGGGWSGLIATSRLLISNPRAYSDWR